MEQFPAEEQQWLVQRFKNLSRSTGRSVDEIQSNFLIWFNKVKEIDPVTLEYGTRSSTDEIQRLIDELLNTTEARNNFGLIEQGFFHCWIKSAQLPFLELTQNGYCECVDTEWRIWVGWKNDIFVVVHKLHDYLTQDEFDNICKQLSSEKLTSFTKWIFKVKNNGMRSMEESNVQELVDKLFNTAEGQEFLNILEQSKFKFIDEGYLALYQLTKPEYRDKIDTKWFLEYDKVTQKYIINNKKYLH